MHVSIGGVYPTKPVDCPGVEFSVSVNRRSVLSIIGAKFRTSIGAQGTGEGPSGVSRFQVPIIDCALDDRYRPTIPNGTPIDDTPFTAHASNS